MSLNAPTARAAAEYFAGKLAFTTGPVELDGMIKRGEPLNIVDVRLPSDFRAGHIPGAINLPKGKWHTVSGIDSNRRTVVYCYNQPCHLAAEAAVEFASRGIAALEMEGGFDTWTKFGLAVETV
jgi:rhodanese-related sulfurtransferase